MVNLRSRILTAFLAGVITACNAPAVAEGQFVRADELDAAIKAEKYKKITSVLVSRNGELVSEQYWGEGGPDYLNDTRSTTKSLTAMAVGAAIMDGHIAGVDEPAFQYFEAERPFRFSSPLKDAITIRDLLTMSSALDCNDNVWESPGNEEHMYPARRWTFFVTDMPTKDDYKRNDAGYGPFSYCTAGSFILGQIIERSAEEPVDKYIERRLLKPLGIEKVNWDRSPSDEVMTGGGTELTSRALMQLGELVRRGGKHGDQQLLTREWTEEMTRVHVSANEEQHYGYQWWRRDFTCGGGAISGWYMAGNGGNKVVVFDKTDMTVVVTAQLYGTSGMHQQSTDIIEEYVLKNLPQCAG